jgi:Fur family transcriptional regulator, ferric uptake regulator
VGTETVEGVLDLLRDRGFRMTPQRRAIVAEIMQVSGHINPMEVSRRVTERVPGVNASTVYRTLGLLEDVGVLSHSHLETGPEYHRRSEGGHVHLICSNCGSADSLTLDEARELRGMLTSRHDFEPDLTHFAISGLCGACRARAAG